MHFITDTDAIAELLQITRDDARRVRAKMRLDGFNFERHHARSAAFKKAASKALDNINQK